MRTGKVSSLRHRILRLSALPLHAAGKGVALSKDFTLVTLLEHLRGGNMSLSSQRKAELEKTEKVSLCQRVYSVLQRNATGDVRRLYRGAVHLHTKPCGVTPSCVRICVCAGLPGDMKLDVDRGGQKAELVSTSFLWIVWTPQQKKFNEYECGKLLFFLSKCWICYDGSLRA